jgi:hypothetical protein
MAAKKVAVMLTPCEASMLLMHALSGLKANKLWQAGDPASEARVKALHHRLAVDCLAAHVAIYADDSGTERVAIKMMKDGLSAIEKLLSAAGN